MFGFVLLGILRDQRPRHGYELLIEYQNITGTKVSPGSVYRELAKLAEAGNLLAVGNQPDADTRRIPYKITAKGSDAFERWLLTAGSHDEDITGLVLFFEQLPAEHREEMLRRQEDNLWMKATTIARLRDDGVPTNRLPAKGTRRSSLSLLRRRLKVIEAEMEFLKEFRREWSITSRGISTLSPTFDGVRDRPPSRSSRSSSTKESK